MFSIGRLKFPPPRGSFRCSVASFILVLLFRLKGEEICKSKARVEFRITENIHDTNVHCASSVLSVQYVSFVCPFVRFLIGICSRISINRTLINCADYWETVNNW